MTLRFFIPKDAGAIAVDADGVAQALQSAANRRHVAIAIVRTGSRGLHWLEPLVEVETAQGRAGYGPVSARDAESILDAALASSEHSLSVGLVEELPFFKKQTRLTFSRCGIVDPASLSDYLAHGGYKGLSRALAVTPESIVDTVTKSGLRGRGGLPHRRQVGHGCQGQSAAKIHRLQCRRGR